MDRWAHYQPQLVDHTWDTLYLIGDSINPGSNWVTAPAEDAGVTGP